LELASLLLENNCTNRRGLSRRIIKEIGCGITILLDGLSVQTHINCHQFRSNLSNMSLKLRRDSNLIVINIANGLVDSLQLVLSRFDIIFQSTTFQSMKLTTTTFSIIGGFLGVPNSFSICFSFPFAFSISNSLTFLRDRGWIACPKEGLSTMAYRSDVIVVDTVCTSILSALGITAKFGSTKIMNDGRPS
jgi:hypothetical protein